MTTTTFFFIFIPILAVILLAVNLIFAPHNPYQEKDSVFECGFHSFLGQNRTQFNISFFIFALLFLLFDLEILLVYPYVVSAYTNGVYGLVVMLIFFLALTLGFVFELGKGALKIDSRQKFTNLTDNNNDSVNRKVFSSRCSYISGYNNLRNKRAFSTSTVRSIDNDDSSMVDNNNEDLNSENERSSDDSPAEDEISSSEGSPGFPSDDSALGNEDDAAPVRCLIAVMYSNEVGRRVEPSELRSTTDHRYYLPGYNSPGEGDSHEGSNSENENSSNDSHEGSNSENENSSNDSHEGSNSEGSDGPSNNAGNNTATNSKNNSGVKRGLDETDFENNSSSSNKRQNTGNADSQSPLDYVIEKSETELPSFYDADGGE